MLNERIADAVPSFWQSKISSYVNGANLDLTYSKQALNKTLGWIVHNWELELANNDFAFIASSQGNWGVLRTLQEIETRTLEYAIWYIDRDFGYAEDMMDMAANAKARTPAEQMARSLLEPFEKSKDDLFAKMEQIKHGMRESEFTKSKAAAGHFNHDIFVWVRLELQRLV